MAHNSYITNTVATFNTKLGGSSNVPLIKVLDLYNIMLDLYVAWDVADKILPCLFDADTNFPSLELSPNVTSVCNKGDSHFWHDTLHPTTIVHKVC
jgi:hypothetical protein